MVYLNEKGEFSPTPASFVPFNAARSAVPNERIEGFLRSLHRLATLPLKGAPKTLANKNRIMVAQNEGSHFVADLSGNRIVSMNCPTISLFDGALRTALMNKFGCWTVFIDTSDTEDMPDDERFLPYLAGLLQEAGADSCEFFARGPVQPA